MSLFKVIPNGENESEWLDKQFLSVHLPRDKHTTLSILADAYESDYVSDELLKKAFTALFEMQYVFVEKHSLYLSMFCVKFYPYGGIGADNGNLRRWATKMYNIMHDPAADRSFSMDIFADGGRVNVAHFELDNNGQLNVTFEDYFKPISAEKANELKKNHLDVDIMEIQDREGFVGHELHVPQVRRSYTDFDRLKPFIKVLAFPSKKMEAWTFAHTLEKKQLLWYKFVNINQLKYDAARKPIVSCYSRDLDQDKLPHSK